ncbi:Skb1 methyltransferase [Hypoxylon trugodes]|uniref:Skb1 methyltransferase n=1 Tax=Hypoxylon trugodes TaxID=326681 RepID=UPI00219136B9|nr:Skb1 methyltransferase [Hypoxylon trugodes]KAI1389124.1 Skb1 methyltransferase [Hypoxylon trugodes]
MSQTLVDQQSEDAHEVRPIFYIGQHDSTRTETLTDTQYGQVLNTGFTFVTTPIANENFHDRVLKLAEASLLDAANDEQPGSIFDPVVPPITIEDTNLFPGTYTSGLIAYSSPWIDLCSSNHVLSSISRQVLNLEVSYANFCGVRSIIIPGPRHDSIQTGNDRGIAQYARAIQEALSIGTRVSIMVHIPMYREPGLEEKVPTLSVLDQDNEESSGREIDLFSSWDSWHTIRSVCDYDARLFVALRIPRALPEKELQTRWFSEPLQYLTLGPQTFQMNKTGYPSLSRYHQEMIFTYMRLKSTPYFLLYDVGPEVPVDTKAEGLSEANFPTLAEAAAQPSSSNTGTFRLLAPNNYTIYLRYLERQQEPLNDLEQNTLTNFQDWLQSPLQPLSDNLESVTYEVFEGDPVKYFQYEVAIAAALRDWAALKKPTSSPGGEVVIAVAGSGRGPLVTRALRASESTGVPVRVWAVEKNPNAYVYLLRQNQREWSGRVTVVKTDMRAWKGPLLSDPSSTDAPIYGKVDILVSELLGSFADNELSPECLDGIQHVLAPESGISIPASYTAHASPISAPRIYADIRQRAANADLTAFDTPWVVRLFAIDFVAQRGVPDHPRFQTAWEFMHPLPKRVMDAAEARRKGGVVGGGGGSMSGSVGANDHNARHCHMTFVCRSRGVVHGLAGYFEAVLYTPDANSQEREEGETRDEETKIELSTLPDNIDRKSKDMISWFPIFFPLKQPLYFPPDTELEVSMWRQTDDTRVWYEWLVEAFMWVGPTQRVKVGGSDLCSSRKVACLL